MTSDYGWRGLTVRNQDGRTGRIRGEYKGFCHVALTIQVEGAKDVAEKAHVQLNTNGPDTGEKGWSWFCPEFSSGPAWLPLGDHNDFGMQLDAEAPRVGLVSAKTE